jgi:hypothetical protein
MSSSNQRLLRIFLINVISAKGRAQTPAARPGFEVACVKRNMSCGGWRGGGGAPASGGLNMECATLRTLVENAVLRATSEGV